MIGIELPNDPFQSEKLSDSANSNTAEFWKSCNSSSNSNNNSPSINEDASLIWNKFADQCSPYQEIFQKFQQTPTILSNIPRNIGNQAQDLDGLLSTFSQINENLTKLSSQSSNVLKKIDSFETESKSKNSLIISSVQKDLEKFQQLKTKSRDSIDKKEKEFQARKSGIEKSKEELKKEKQELEKRIREIDQQLSSLDQESQTLPSNLEIIGKLKSSISKFEKIQVKPREKVLIACKEASGLLNIVFLSFLPKYTKIKK